MIYKNKEQVDSICAEIETHMEKLNDLCGAHTVSIADTNNHKVFMIVVRPDSEDEYTQTGMIMIKVIKDDLKRKIADLHTELKEL